MSRRAHFFRRAAVVVALVVALLSAARWLWAARFFAGYDQELPLEVKVLERSEVAPGHAREILTFQALPGETTTALFHYPTAAGRPAPCLVMLLWYRARAGYLEAAAGAYVEEGFAVLTPEGLGFRETGRAPAQRGLRRASYVLGAGRRAVIEARRAVDLLAARPEIDARRIVLCGASLGAIVATPALAQEPRFRAGILMWGGGDLPRMISGYARRRGLGLRDRWLLQAAARVLAPAEPLDWIERVAPRPVLFQNARGDDVLPEASIRALHRRAREPKTVLWYEGVHQQRVEEAVVAEAIRDQIAWLRRLESWGG